MCRDRIRVKLRLVGNAVDNNTLGWQFWAEEPTVIKPKDWPQLQLVGFMSKPDVLPCLPLCRVQRSRLFSLSHQLISWSQSLLSLSNGCLAHKSLFCLPTPSPTLPVLSLPHSLRFLSRSVFVLFCFCSSLPRLGFLSLPLSPLTARSSFFFQHTWQRSSTWKKTFWRSRALAVSFFTLKTKKGMLISITQKERKRKKETKSRSGKKTETVLCDDFIHHVNCSLLRFLQAPFWHCTLKIEQCGSVAGREGINHAREEYIPLVTSQSPPLPPPKPLCSGNTQYSIRR